MNIIQKPKRTVILYFISFTAALTLSYPRITDLCSEPLCQGLR